ncbi:Uncharacterised protein [Mycobacteroides abscessus subsp. abscessus]|nr:Uncharacterised protein [Mycobacteroides abscessus subsp. abscessus]
MRDATRLLDECDGLIGTVQVHIGKHYFGTLPGEFKCGFPADTTAATGDDHQLVLERFATLAHFCPP